MENESQAVELVHCSLKGVYLTYEEKGEERVRRIPQGLIQNNPDTVFTKLNDKLYAKLEGETCQIWPVQKWTLSAGGMHFSVRLARTVDELKAAKKLLLDHYMGIPNRGLFVNVYHESSIEPIACGCLDRLYYAMPVGRKDILDKAGRRDLMTIVFPKEEKAEDKHGQSFENVNTLESSETGKNVIKKGLRARVVNELRIVWISRIAIIGDSNNSPDADVEKNNRKQISFRGIHLSERLAELMGKIAHECMLPHADYIEVFMSCPKDEAQYRREHNLYLHAGFQLFDKTIKSSKMVFLDHEDEGYIAAAKLYLYKDLRDNK